MAKADSITVNVKVGIPNETIERCLRILEMWMDDHPHERIVVDREMTTKGFRHNIRIEND